MNRIGKIAVLLTILVTSVFAAEFKASENTIYPEPAGGMVTLAKAVVYPDSARKNGIEGKVFVEVVISATGKVEKTEVKRGVNPDLDQAAVTAIQKIDWKPGKMDGKPEKMVVVIPVQFKLDKDCFEKSKQKQ